MVFAGVMFSLALFLAGMVPNLHGWRFPWLGMVIALKGWCDAGMVFSLTWLGAALAWHDDVQSPALVRYCGSSGDVAMKIVMEIVY